MADTRLPQLVINQLTKAQYEALTPEANQLYLTPDTTEQDIANAVSAHDSSSSAHQDIRNLIPTVGNATITFKQGDAIKGSFTTNQANNATIQLDEGGGSIDAIDEISITKNADEEIQTIGVINQNATTTALKMWSGTLAQYNAITTKDSNTFYNITDDVTPGEGGGSYTAGTGIDITNNVISANTMVGATGSAAGTKGAVPAPTATDNAKFLRGDGTWQEIKTYLSFPEAFVTSGTLQEVVTSMMEAEGYNETGMAYLGGISGACMPWPGGGNAECKVEYFETGMPVLTLCSSNVPPYRWEYHSYNNDYKWKKAVAQMEVMPTENLDLAVGIIVQYIGTTDSTYTNGYFYKCVEDSGNYVWQQCNVQPGGGSSYTAGNGIDITDNVISVTTPTLTNTTTGTNSLTVGGTATTGNYATNIGINSIVSSNQGTAVGYASNVSSNGTAIGYDSKSTNAGGTAIGYSTRAGFGCAALGHGTQATGSECTALGCNAITTANAAIQLGKGTNSTQATFNVSLDTTPFPNLDPNKNYRLLNSDGTMPIERLGGGLSVASKYLKGDGTWVDVVDDSSTSAEDKTWSANKLNTTIGNLETILLSL